MFALLRNLSPRPARSWCASSSRALATARPRRRSEPSEDDEQEADDPLRGVQVTKDDRNYQRWQLLEGMQFKNPSRPRNWLGGQVPFPLNPSFKPPTPVSDELRTILYSQYMANPVDNGVRQLAERYGLSIKRVDAILRLKGLEEHWKKNKPLQTGFLAGMEHMLGITQDAQIRRHRPTSSDLGEDTTEADIQADMDGNDAARDRYQRFFWEPVVEGRDAVMPAILERARTDAEKYAKAAEDVKSDPQFLSPQPDTPKDKVHLVIREGRPAVQFVDVGGKFLDVKDRLRRMKEAERRSKVRARRRERKEQAFRKEQQASLAAKVEKTKAVN